MDIYLPIAGLSVNILVIIGLGGVVGLLSGMFGVGGGFLVTPMLIFYGIPPVVAVASSATQITGTSVSGVLAYLQHRKVDVRMGMVLVAGGILGSISGGFLFRWLQQTGQIDTVVGLLYVCLLGGVGGFMAQESARAIMTMRRGEALAVRRLRPHSLVTMLPMRWRFYGSGLYISPLAPFVLGIISGILTVLLGVGGGFLMVPAMIYLLGMSTMVVVGTSLFQILFVTAVSTVVHAVTTQAVDIVLALFLLIGSVIGAQLGARIAARLSPEWLRLMLAMIVLLVALRMALGLGWQPDEIYTVQLG